MPVRTRSLVAGVLAFGFLPALNLSLISLAQGFDHARTQFRADLPLLAIIALGFGMQIALFVELRTLHRQHRGSAALTATGAGAGTVAMVACCAHHLVDVLPLVGLSAAAALLSDYRVPIVAFSVGVNILGVVVMSRQLRTARRHRRLASATA